MGVFFSITWVLTSFLHLVYLIILFLIYLNWQRVVPVIIIMLVIMSECISMNPKNPSMIYPYEGQSVVQVEWK